MPRGGPRLNSGGKRPGSGRKPGSPNKISHEVAGLAQQYGPGAVKRLAELGGLALRRKGEAQSEQARVSALNSLLDRAYGKATQPLQHGVDGGTVLGLIAIPPKTPDA